MKYRIKVGEEGATIDFADFTDLGKHYGMLADACRQRAMDQGRHTEERFFEGKATAYDLVSWQLQQVEIID